MIRSKRNKRKIDQIKTLSIVSTTIENPKNTINGEELIIPVEIESCMCLELISATDPMLYKSKGEITKRDCIKK